MELLGSLPPGSPSILHTAARKFLLKIHYEHVTWLKILWWLSIVKLDILCLLLENHCACSIMDCLNQAPWLDFHVAVGIGRHRRRSEV